MADDLTVERIAALVAPVARRYPVRAITLFGSRARGDHRPDSDVDLHVDWDGDGVPRAALLLGGLYVDLEAALGVGIDLLDRPLSQMTVGKARHIAQRIISEGVRIYER